MANPRADVPSTTVLLRMVSEGQRTALGHLVGVYEPLLCAAVRRYLGPERFSRDGEDLLQSIRLAIVKSLPRFEGRERPAFVAWIRTVVRSQIIDWERARRSRRRNPDRPLVSVDDTSFPGIAAGSASPSTRLLEKEDLEALRRAIDRVPERYRGVLSFILDRHPTSEEVSAFVGKPAEAARKFVGRALQRLEISLRTQGRAGAGDD